MNKRKYKYRTAFLVVLLSVLNFGCASETKTDIEQFSNPEKITWNKEVMGENLVADFKTEKKEVTEAYSYVCKRNPLSVESIKDCFFAYDTSICKTESRLYDPDLPEFGDIFFLTSENGIQISSSNYGSYAETILSEYYLYFLATDQDAWSNSNIPINLGTNEELPWLSKSEIEEEIKRGMCKLFPYADIENITFFTLSSDYLNELQLTELQLLKKEQDTFWYDKAKQFERMWTDEEGAYYISVELKMDEITVNGKTNTTFSDERKISIYNATFIYNQEGCVYAELPIYLEMEEKEKQQVISASQALGILRDDILEVILTDENVINDADIQYVMIATPGTLSVEIKPMWIFEGTVIMENEKKEGNEKVEYSINYFVDASNGEVLH